MTKKQKIDRTLDDLAKGLGSRQRAQEIMLGQFLRSALVGTVDYEILDSATTTASLCDLWFLYRQSAPSLVAKA